MIGFLQVTLKDGEVYCSHCQGTGYSPSQDKFETEGTLVQCPICKTYGKTVVNSLQPGAES